MIDSTIQEQLLKQDNIQQCVELTCLSCSICAFFSPSQQISKTLQGDIILIKISNNQTYCMPCLLLKIKQQKKETMFLQQRFIYFKQFQSSFEHQQLLKHKIHEQNIQNSSRDEIQIRQLQEEEERIMKQIGKFKQEENSLKTKIYNLEVEEEKFWEGINKIERRANKVQEKSLLTKFNNNSNQDDLKYISTMSVLHVFIDIKVDDSLAYVQGMAIGKKGQHIQILWEQISIGLGHLLIGLNFLIIKYSYQFKKIQKIKIKGFITQIILKQKSKTLTTHCKQNQKSFGQFLQILLHETYYLCQHILQIENIQYSQEYKLPFSINPIDCKIVDLFIDPWKIEERTRWNIWTKAMRYFLIDYKHILTVYAICDKYI